MYQSPFSSLFGVSIPMETNTCPASPASGLFLKMLTWSTSATTTTKPSIYRSTQSKVAEDFLQSWDNAVYDGKPIGDHELDREAALWREQFPHLRIIGVNIEHGGGNKVTLPQKTMSQSKSAYTFREKNREISLPRIDKMKKK